jgi:hypothetical protein
MVLTAAVAALFLTGGVVASGSADQAEAKSRKKVYDGYSENYRYRGRPVYDDNSRWYPNDADQLKIGSRIWYDQMEREGRMGRPRG